MEYQRSKISSTGLIFSCVLLLLSSCTPALTQMYQYEINVREIDGKSGRVVNENKSRYISHSQGLFEYDFIFKNKVIIDSNGQVGAGIRNDSVSISFIPLGKPLYFQYDFEGKYLQSDSIKRKKQSFIKIIAENRERDSVYQIMSRIREVDLRDTLISGTAYKIYNHSVPIKDALGETYVNLFFLKSNNLITPFNVAGRYPQLFDKYAFAGLSYHVLNADQWLISVILNIKPVTPGQENLCKLILNKISR